MDFIFDTLFETPGKCEGAERKKPWKGKIQTLRANKCVKTTKLNWCNVAELASQTPAPEVLRRPLGQPIRLGLDFSGYGTDSLAWHYLGANYQVAFVAERSSVKDTLRMALEKHVTHKKPMAVYSDVRVRSTKDVPHCDDFATGPSCRTFSSLVERMGTLVAQGWLLLHSLH